MFLIGYFRIFRIVFADGVYAFNRILYFVGFSELLKPDGVCDVAPGREWQATWMRGIRSLVEATGSWRERWQDVGELYQVHSGNKPLGQTKTSQAKTGSKILQAHLTNGSAASTSR